MSDRTIERLLACLERAGLDIGDEEIADSIWLAMQRAARSLPKSSPRSSESESPESRQPGKQQEVRSLPPQGETDGRPLPDGEDGPPELDAILPSDAPSEAEGDGEGEPGLPFQAPATTALQNALAIGRALRPLMRKVPSPTRQVLDEEATVSQIAERDLWIPVLKPERERWLDLELVVEESRSSFIWRDAVEDFQQLLQCQGAFRNVRVWRLRPSENGEPQLLPSERAGKAYLRPRGHLELLHASKRGLILLVSDCTSALWVRARLHRWLQDWSRHEPTALVQLMPERLWSSSELGLGSEVRLAALAPGIANPKLVLESLVAWEREEIDWSQALLLPVVTLEAFSLKPWAGVVSGAGNAEVPGILFDLPFVEGQAKQDAAAPSIALEPSVLVDRFLATASLPARRLAGMMAAAPVSLPVVHLIQRKLLPNSTPVHVAEVFLSGMVRRVSTGEEPARYEFVGETRKLLNVAMRWDETRKVLDAVSEYVAEKLGRSFYSFDALLLAQRDASDAERAEILPFARVAIEVLHNLGGDFTAYADEFDDRPVDKDLEIQPKLEEFEFETATISLETAAVWNVRCRRERSRQFVENLGNGVTLEMVAIPGGTFMMGSPEDEPGRYRRESPRHEVTVLNFFMSKYLVTQAQWRAIAALPQVEWALGMDPSRFKGDDLPVEGVSWYDAIEFCRRLSQITGREYRLPSEAEWEYACRAGTTTPFHFGETISTKLVNYNGSSYASGPKGKHRGKTIPVGSFPANAFGLHDMHGNLWEWCADEWHGNYGGTPDDGIAWIDDKVHNRNLSYVLRGGSWLDFPGDCRSAFRSCVRPNSCDGDFGFRTACGLKVNFN